MSFCPSVCIRLSVCVSLHLSASVCVCRSGKQGKLTVRTEDEEDDIQTGQSPGVFSVLDLSYNTKFFIGGVLRQAVDVVSISSHRLHGSAAQL